MRIRYDLEVSRPVTVEQEFSYLFGRTSLSYGKFTYRFDQQQIHHERAIQKMLSLHPEIKGKATLDDLGVD